MCGICGIYNTQGKNLDRERIIKMRDIMRHRGPDDAGLYIGDKVALGHRRLSIIDLTSSAHQPMFNEDKSLAVVFNGEIYNYKDLREYLTSRGHKFISNSDTETILHGFEEWNENVFEKLDGMFAFALWDKPNGQIYLARDPLGIKPLYYYYDNESLIFASEIKSLLASGLIKREIDTQALSDYFSYFYIPGSNSIIKDIRILCPAHYARFPSSGEIEKRYWDIKIDTGLSKIKYADLKAAVKEHVKQAVKKSLVSDVPVGILLSAGIDSNIILAEMAELYPHKIKSFTVSFKEASFDEGGIARESASLFNTEHYEHRFDKASFLDFFDSSIYHLDCLNANPAALACYSFYRLASEKIKVALVGSGGDELFAGYPTYVANRMFRYYSRAPARAKKIMSNIAACLPVNYKKYSYNYALKRFCEAAFYSREKAHYWWRVIFSDVEKKSLLAPIAEGLELDASHHYIERFNQGYSKNLGFDDAALVSDFYTFLIDNANMLVDNLGMAFSLEVRPPFLTKDFVNFSFSLPYNYKIKLFKTKEILRQAYRDKLPKQVVNMKKHSLQVPLGELFLKELKDYVYDHLYSWDSALLSAAFIKDTLKRHYEKKEDNSFKIYTLLVFKRWLDLVLLNNSARYA